MREPPTFTPVQLVYPLRANWRQSRLFAISLKAAPRATARSFHLNELTRNLRILREVQIALSILPHMFVRRIGPENLQVSTGYSNRTEHHSKSPFSKNARLPQADYKRHAPRDSGDLPLEVDTDSCILPFPARIHLDRSGPAIPS